MGEVRDICNRHDGKYFSGIPAATRKLLDEARTATVSGDVTGAILILIRRNGLKPILEATDSATYDRRQSLRLLDDMTNMVTLID